MFEKVYLNTRIPVQEDVQTTDTQKGWRPPRFTGSSFWGCPHQMNAEHSACTIDRAPLSCPNPVHCTCQSDTHTAPFLRPHQRQWVKRAQDLGWQCPTPMHFPQNLFVLLTPCALKNMSSMRSSIMTKYVAPRFRRGIHWAFGHLNVTNSPIKTRQRLKIFSLHRPIPFHKSLIVSREKRTHSSA